jgi:hypothetical protein
MHQPKKIEKSNKSNNFKESKANPGKTDSNLNEDMLQRRESAPGSEVFTKIESENRLLSFRSHKTTMEILDRIKRFDIYRQVPNDLTEATLSGAVGLCHSLFLDF